jgi:hypothetical protein
MLLDVNVLIAKIKKKVQQHLILVEITKTKAVVQLVNIFNYLQLCLAYDWTIKDE